MHMNAYIKPHLLLNLMQKMLLRMVKVMGLLNEMDDNVLTFFLRVKCALYQRSVYHTVIDDS
jgi:hypothetical protein